MGGRRTLIWLVLGLGAVVVSGVPMAGSVPGPRLAAHRGGAGLWAENSLPAFRGALALGVDLVEFDVHLTRDGRAVVIHDATLERTSTGIGAIGASTLAELRGYRLRDREGRPSDDNIPTLEEVLDLVGPTPAGLLVEIKTGPRRARYEGIEERVLSLLGARELRGRTVVMSFDPGVVKRVRELDPSIRTSLLVSTRGLEREGAAPEQAVEWAVSVGATDIGLQHALITPAVLAAARARGLRVGAWTVNDEPEMRRVIEAGVDILITDRPDLAKPLLGR